MKRLFSLLLLGFAFAFSQDTLGKSIALLDYEALGMQKDEAKIFSNELRGRFVGNHSNRLLERSQMEQILAEQAFQQSGACESSECQLQTGRLLSVDRLITGSIGLTKDSVYFVNTKILNVETGEIEASIQANYDGPYSGLLIHFIPKLATRLQSALESLQKNTPLDTSLLSVSNVDDMWTKQKNSFNSVRYTLHYARMTMDLNEISWLVNHAFDEPDGSVNLWGDTARQIQGIGAGLQYLRHRKQWTSSGTWFSLNYGCGYEFTLGQFSYHETYGDSSVQRLYGLLFQSVYAPLGITLGTRPPFSLSVAWKPALQLVAGFYGVPPALKKYESWDGPAVYGYGDLNLGQFEASLDFYAFGESQAKTRHYLSLYAFGAMKTEQSPSVVGVGLGVNRY